MHDLPIATHWYGVSLLPADLASFDSVTSDYQDLTAVSFFFFKNLHPNFRGIGTNLHSHQLGAHNVFLFPPVSLPAFGLMYVVCFLMVATLG